MPDQRYSSISPRHNPVKLGGHLRSVRGVAFSPQDPYLMASGAYDGLVNFYDVQKMQLKKTCCILNGTTRFINCVDFMTDSRKVVAGSNSKQLFILDVEAGEKINTYENCVFNGSDRTALATPSPAQWHGGYSNNQYLIACCDVDGRGLNIFDVRANKLIRSLKNIHEKSIRDLQFLHQSWYSNSLNEPLLITASQDGLSKVINLDGNSFQIFDVKCSLYSVATTPEPFGHAVGSYKSTFCFGGDCIVIESPDGEVHEKFVENCSSPVWKICYTHVGTDMYAACDDGLVRHYRRTSKGHEFCGVILSHSNDIEDMALSVNDEYLATASQDKSVGLLWIHEPSSGYSEYGELI